mmetsp:Transcript_38753/g.69857  ORF Transcript_38753/g.69857 Transcript_38753/m.69857 type:complete len:202 (+) Transcript_38753:506-1111(+)
MTLLQMMVKTLSVLLPSRLCKLPSSPQRKHPDDKSYPHPRRTRPSPPRYSYQSANSISSNFFQGRLSRPRRCLGDRLINRVYASRATLALPSRPVARQQQQRLGATMASMICTGRLRQSLHVALGRAMWGTSPRSPSSFSPKCRCLNFLSRPSSKGARRVGTTTSVNFAIVLSCHRASCYRRSTEDIPSRKETCQKTFPFT